MARRRCSQLRFLRHATSRYLALRGVATDSSRSVKKAMETRLGSNSDEVLKVLAKQGITRTLAKEALEVARSHGEITMPRWGGHHRPVVDALARISGKLANAGERSEVDQKALALLSLAK